MLECGARDLPALAAPAHDPRYDEIRDLGDLAEHSLKELRHFFTHYKELEEKAGNYRDERFGQWIAVSVDKDKLKAAGLRGGREFVFTPTGSSSFVALEAPFPMTLEFPPAEAGRPATAVFKGREDATKFTKAAPVKPLAEAQLGGYAGIYASEELLGASYRLDIEKGNLVVNFRSIPLTQLKAMAPDQFSAGSFNLDFVRDKGNKISGFNLSMGRVAGIVFTKKSPDAEFPGGRKSRDH